MIQPRKQNPAPVAEPETGRPVGTGEEWLGRNRSSKRLLWERLNPRSRKQIRLIAEALALQQTHAQLAEPLRARLSASIDRKSTRLNSSHGYISYAVFCLKKKKKRTTGLSQKWVSRRLYCSVS